MNVFSQSHQIVEAQGIVKTANGRVLLGTLIPQNYQVANDLICEKDLANESE